MHAYLEQLSKIFEEFVRPKVVVYRKADQDGYFLMVRWLDWCVENNISDFVNRSQLSDKIMFSDILPIVKTTISDLAAHITNSVKAPSEN